MTIYLPPDEAFQDCLFSMDHNVAAASVGAGTKISRTELADPIWTVEISTRPYFAKSAEARAWRALRAKLRGGIHLLKLWDLTQPAPLAYADAQVVTDIAGSWDGIGGVVSISGTAITVNSLPAYYQASIGDYIGLEENDRFGLYEIVNAATANGLGVIDLVTGVPMQTSLFTTFATARLWRPYATFAITDSSWSFPTDVNPGPVAFTGAQVV